MRRSVLVFDASGARGKTRKAVAVAAARPSPVDRCDGGAVTDFADCRLFGLAQAAMILLSADFKIRSGALRARIACEVVGNGRESGSGNMGFLAMRGRAVHHPGGVSTRKGLFAGNAIAAVE